MSESERKVADTKGQFLLAVEDGRSLPSPSWESCRIVLTTERLLLIAEAERELPLRALDDIENKGPYVQDAAPVSEYLPLRFGDDVILLSAAEQETFETDLFRAVLDDEVCLVRHPAVEGGVVKDVDWTKGQMTVSAEALTIERSKEDGPTIERSDIGSCSRETEPVRGEERTVFVVEHARDGTSVETHLVADDLHETVLAVMLREGAARNSTDIDLSSVERQVVVALYSGVSPFDVPSFVGVDVDRTEEIFDRLIELDVISVVRERTEVRLATKGRRIASEKGSDR